MCVCVCVFGILLYGYETWTLLKREMCIQRRMKRTKRYDRVSNKMVLNRIKETITLLKIIIKRKGEWVEHLLEEKEYVRTVIEATREEKIKRGRKRLNLIDEGIEEDLGQENQRQADSASQQGTM